MEEELFKRCDGYRDRRDNCRGFAKRDEWYCDECQYERLKARSEYEAKQQSPSTSFTAVNQSTKENENESIG